MPTSSPRRPRIDPALLELASGALGARSSQALLSWYDAHHRRLPWRPETPEQRDPYRTWLSEIMLQQTRVETVVPYFQRFLERFPTVDALALAPLDDVLSVWSGLGYYSRARNLHAAARLVAAAGSFPDTLAGLRALPGVGAYVSGAVASIAFGLDAAAVDGNVERVLSRLFAFAGGRAGVHRLATAMLPSGRAGELNQALMDLGSSVCTARRPSCSVCPLQTGCRALAAGTIQQFPPKKIRRVVPQRQALAIVLWRGGRVLLARRPPAGLFGGLYELPGDFIGSDEPLAAAVQRVSAERLGFTLRLEERLGEVRHTLTHMRLRLVVVTAQAAGPLVLGEGPLPPLRPSWYTATSWVNPAAPVDLGLSTLARKSLVLAAGSAGQVGPGPS